MSSCCLCPYHSLDTTPLTFLSFRKPLWNSFGQWSILAPRLPSSYPFFSLSCFILLITCPNIISWRKFLLLCCLCWPWVRLNDSSNGNILYFLAHCKCKCRLIPRKVAVFGAWVLGTKICHPYKLSPLNSEQTIWPLFKAEITLFVMYRRTRSGEGKLIFTLSYQTIHFHLTMKLQFHLSHRYRKFDFM